VAPHQTQCEPSRLVPGPVPDPGARVGVLLRIFFEPRLLRSARSWKYTVYGHLWSYALDAIAVAAAFVVPGGVWVC
jgi:hypothetical protein